MTVEKSGNARVSFLDTLRIFAIFLVMLVHCCEVYYFGDDGGVFIETKGDAFWLTLIDSFSRSAVPLFVMASAYLLFPVTRPTGEFLKRRFARVLIPFSLWALAYNWHHNGSWGQLLFNFPATTGGHLWFVPMLCGLYLLMPLLSPWAEKAGEKEVRGWLCLWAFTTTFPFLRHLWGWLYGAPTYGVTPFLYGECAWNGFGTFHYVSGFIGYMLLGFWFRRFCPEINWRRTLSLALPLLAIGWVIVWSGFYFRIPTANGWPVKAPYAEAVSLEMSWEFCSTGVVMVTAGYFLILRKLGASGALAKWLTRPLAEASFGVYLMHMFILTPVIGALRHAVPTPLAILCGGFLVFASASVISLVVRRIPRVGKYICG